MAEREVYERLRDVEVEAGKLSTRVAAAERVAAAGERRLEAMSTQLTRIEERVGGLDELARWVREVAHKLDGENGLSTRLRLLEEGRRGASKAWWMVLATALAGVGGWFARKLGS